MMQRPFYNPLEDTASGIGGPVSGGTAGSVLFVGTGSVLAQDNANFYFNDTTNALLLGSSSVAGTAYGRAGETFEINTSANNGGMAISTWSAAAATHGALLDFNRSKSSTIGTHTVVASGDNLGNIYFRGSDGTAFRDAVQISAEVDGTPGASDMPGRLIFSTTADGAASATERLRIDSLGRIQQQVGGATAQALAGSTFVVAKSQSGITTVGSGRYFSLQNTGGSANEVVEIGFGYIGAGVNQPVLIGHKVSDATASTKGSLYMAVRNVTTDTAPTEVWTLDSTGQVTQNMPAAASTAETLHTWKISDDSTAKLEVRSGTTVDGAYIPQLRGFGSSALTGLQFVAQLTTDTGANTAMLFDARVGASTAVATRPLFQWTNNGTGVMILDNRGRFTLAPLAATSGITAQFILTPGADTGLTASTESNVFRVDAATRTWATTGTVATQRDVMMNGQTYASASASQTFTIASTLFASSPIAGTNATITNSYAAWFEASAIASAAEKIARFSVSDDSVAYLSIQSGTTADGSFIPQLRGFGSSSLTGLQLVSQIVTDTGTNPAASFDARVGASTAVATRPIFEWSNNGTAVLSMLPLNSAANSCLSWGTGAIAAPAFTTRSNGTRLVLYNGLTDSTMDSAIGIESGATWFATAQATSAYSHKFYAGTTLNAMLRGDGILSLGTNTTMYSRLGQKLEINASAIQGGAALSTWSATADQAATLDFNRSKSAAIGTFTVAAANDALGYIVFRGSDGTNFEDAAYIKGSVDGTPGNNDMPGRVGIFTTPDGSNTASEALRVSSRRNTIVNIDGVSEPSTSVGTLVLTNAATAPTTSVDVVSLFAADVAGAGTASLALYTEQAVATESVTSDRTLLVNINGTAYKICLKA